MYENNMRKTTKQINKIKLHSTKSQSYFIDIDKLILKFASKDKNP